MGAALVAARAEEDVRCAPFSVGGIACAIVLFQNQAG
jgi:hypothetical protein